MLTTIENANNQYFFAMKRGFSHRAYWIILVKIMGSVSNEMASLGSITNIKNAMAAAGNPMPKKPLMMPANRKIITTEMVIARFCDGKM